MSRCCEGHKIEENLDNLAPTCASHKACARCGGCAVCGTPKALRKGPAIASSSCARRLDFNEGQLSGSALGSTRPSDSRPSNIGLDDFDGLQLVDVELMGL